MKTYNGIATIIYHQDPVTGFLAYAIEPHVVSATIIENGINQWTISFSYPFNHSKTGETVELGITHTYSSNPKIWTDLEHHPIITSDLPENVNLTFFEDKRNNEAPWAHPRRFTLRFNMNALEH